MSDYVEAQKTKITPNLGCKKRHHEGNGICGERWGERQTEREAREARKNKSFEEKELMLDHHAEFPRK